jgi:DNA invertase Pin-like site-specific DNA recombinase
MSETSGGVTNGKVRGRTPFGYYRQDGQLFPNKAEQKIVQDMIAMRDQGLGLSEISRKLIMRGVRLSPTGVAIVLFEHLGRPIPRQAELAPAEAAVEA